MRFLIVDDELINRKILEKIVSAVAQSDLVHSGQTAINAFVKAWENWSPYDLILLDIAMPNMDGKDVLEQIRKLETDKKVPPDKKCKIVMVTGASDKATIVSCVQLGCDDYIVKPIDAKPLALKLRRLNVWPDSIEIKPDKKIDKQKSKQALGVTSAPKAAPSVREAIVGIVELYKKGNVSLPVLPQVIQNVERVLNEPHSDTEDLANVIKKDSVITIRLLAVANSPFYRGTEQITDVSQAIPRLGFKETRSIVMAIANKSQYQVDNREFKTLMEALWTHSAASAYCAKSIAQKLRLPEVEKLFLMGLVHDIGSVFLIKNLSDISVEKNVSFNHEEILKGVQDTHLQFGGAILKRWGFDQSFVEVAAEHDKSLYSPNTSKNILIVNLANNIARNMGFSLHDDPVDMEALSSRELLAIDIATIDAISSRVAMAVQKSADAF